MAIGLVLHRMKENGSIVVEDRRREESNIIRKLPNKKYFFCIKFTSGIPALIGTQF